MPIKEEDFRNGDWGLLRTEVRERAEIDIYGAATLPGIEIRVRLVEDVLGEMSFHSLSVLDDQRSELRLDGDAGALSSDAVEVVAWEILEGQPELTNYLEGRLPAEQDGRRARPGTIILRLNEPDPTEETPELW